MGMHHVLDNLVNSDSIQYKRYHHRYISSMSIVYVVQKNDESREEQK